MIEAALIGLAVVNATLLVWIDRIDASQRRRRWLDEIPVIVVTVALAGFVAVVLVRG